jgi:low temperature requirement protein LtrA
VFVAAIAQISYVLTDDLTFGGFVRYIGLFVPIWWAWMGFTFYANRFDTDDLPYRLLTLVAMLAIAALAVNVRDALSGGSGGFALSYACVRLVLLVLYARARRHVEQARPLATLYLAFFGAAVVLWFVSIAVPEPGRYWLWAAALAIELSAPVFGWRLIPVAPIDPRHLPERFGLLTIIVLGESVLAVVVGTSDVQWRLSTALAATAGFVSAASLWWLYFDFLDDTFVGRSIVRGLVFTYANFFVVVGLASLGTGVKLAVLATGPGGRYDDTGWVLGAGTAMFMIGLVAIQLATPPMLFDVDVWLRLGTAAFAAGLAGLSSVLSPHVIAWLLAASLALQVAVELARHEEHVGREGSV